MNIAMNLSDDRRSIKLRFTGVGLAFEFAFSTEDFDVFLAKLGDMRAQMQPAVVADHKPETSGEAFPDPKWAVEQDLMLGHPLLHLRDPRFGWLHYLMPPAEARNLADALASTAMQPHPSPQMGKAN